MWLLVQICFLYKIFNPKILNQYFLPKMYVSQENFPKNSFRLFNNLFYPTFWIIFFIKIFSEKYFWPKFFLDKNLYFDQK